MRVRTTRDDAGFTLIELLVAVVILGVIAAPLAGMVMSYFTTSDGTAARMGDSHSAQMAAAFFAQDVQSTGVRAYSAAPAADGTYPLQQSVETTGGALPCGDASLPSVVRLGWDDFATVPTGVADVGTARTLVVAAYVLEDGELHRLLCVGSSTPTSDVRIAEHVVSAEVSCSTACTAAAVPTGVTLTLRVQNPDSPAEYSLTLDGRRRQS